MGQIKRPRDGGFGPEYQIRRRIPLRERRSGQRQLTIKEFGNFDGVPFVFLRRIRLVYS